MLAGFFDSPAEIGIILLVVLLLFGGSQLPKLAKNIGKAQKEFKDGLAEGQKKGEALAEKAAEKLLDGEFTLDDFLEQMQALKKMGPLGNLMGMMPGMPKEMKNAQIGDDQLKPIEAIIRSMTPQERRKPEIINGSRRNRIAMGSGTTVGDVNRLVKQFAEMQKMMKRMGAMAGARPGKKGKKDRSHWTPGRKRDHCKLSSATRKAILHVVRKYMAQNPDGTFAKFGSTDFWKQGYEKAVRVAMTEASTVTRKRACRPGSKR